MGLMDLFRRRDGNPVELPEILVIDDDSACLDLLAIILKDYRAVSTTSPQEGLQLANYYHRSLRIVMSDYQMPGIDGKAVLQQVRSINPDIIRVLFSGALLPQDLFLYNEIYDEAFTKPIRVEKVLGLVEYIMSPDFIRKTPATQELRQQVSDAGNPPPELIEVLTNIQGRLCNGRAY